MQPFWSHARTVAFQVDTGVEGDAAVASSAVPLVIRRQSRGSQALPLARSMGSAGTSPFSSALKGCTGEGINPMTWLHIGTGFTSACKGYICMQGSAALLRIPRPHRVMPVLAGVRKLASLEHSRRQSVDAFVEAASEKDAMQELQVVLIPAIVRTGICVATQQALRQANGTSSDLWEYLISGICVQPLSELDRQEAVVMSWAICLRCNQQGW